MLTTVMDLGLPLADLRKFLKDYAEAEPCICPWCGGEAGVSAALADLGIKLATIVLEDVKEEGIRPYEEKLLLMQLERWLDGENCENPTELAPLLRKEIADVQDPYDRSVWRSALTLLAAKGLA